MCYHESMNIKENLNKFKKNAREITIENDKKLAKKPMLVYNGFIGEKADIKPYSDDYGFRLNDDTLYNDLAAKKGSADKDFAQDLPLIQNAIDEYFVGGEDGVAQVHTKQAESGQKINSIKDYKGFGGQCIHKAAVANNMLNLLGYDCRMVLTDITSANESGNHAFVIIRDQAKNVGYIFDPANRTKVHFKSGAVAKTPTLIEKPLSQLDDYMAGKGELEITEQDEKDKNARQQGEFNLELPRIKYCSRFGVKSFDLQMQEKNAVVSNYVDGLTKRGLGREEIERLLNRIADDVKSNISPKLDSLQAVYDQFRAGNINIADHLPASIQNDEERERHV